MRQDRRFEELARELAARRGLNLDGDDPHEQAIVNALRIVVDESMAQLAPIAAAHPNGRAWLAVLLTACAQAALETPETQEPRRSEHID